MPSRPARALALLLALPIAACTTAAPPAGAPAGPSADASVGAPAGAPAGAVEPSEKNVVDFLDRGEGQRSEDVLWVTNRSSLPIVVVGVTLRECENVGQPCGQPISLLVRVAPGERKQVLRIRANLETNPFRYDYTFAWRKADALDPAR